MSEWMYGSVPLVVRNGTVAVKASEIAGFGVLKRELRGDAGASSVGNSAIDTDAAQLAEHGHVLPQQPHLNARNGRRLKDFASPGADTRSEEHHT